VQSAEKQSFCAMKHVPVLATSVLKAFEQAPFHKSARGGCYVDLTLGLGGHASLIAEKYRPKIFVGFDRDASMLKIAESNVRAKARTLNEYDPELHFVHGNYSEISTKFPASVTSADAILMDLGVASPHFDDPERGLSFRFDAPLDMRLDRSQTLTAAHIVNKYSEHELGRIFREYGEERHWRAAARVLVGARREIGSAGIQRTQKLVEILEPVLGPRVGRTHPCTQVFQALRMAVNQELEHLSTAIPRVINKLTSPGGVLAVISFHSLEDRVVKQNFLKAESDGLASFVTKNPKTALKEEIAGNPRSRSAKLRILVRK